MSAEKRPRRQVVRGPGGFTLLEVMVALAMIAIGLVAVLASQSQSVSLANEARFNALAALLAQDKMAELAAAADQLGGGDQGDFGEDFPGFRWRAEVSEAGSDEAGVAAGRLKRIELEVLGGSRDQFRFSLRTYLLLEKEGA